MEWASAPSPFQCNSPMSAQVITYVQAVASGTWTTTSTSMSAETSIWGVQINGILFAKPTPTVTATITSETLLASTKTPESSHESGLAKRAKIGIGIGAAMAFVLLSAVLIVGMLFWKRRREASKPTEVTIGSYPGDDQKSFHNVTVNERQDARDEMVDSRRHVGMG